MSSSSQRGFAGEPEYLGSAPRRRRARRGAAVLAVASASVVGAAAVGAWAAFSFLSGGGSQPAEAVPADAAVYVSLDLDPSASQKVEAFRMLEKFPGIEQELGLETTDDIRRLVFDKVVLEERGCAGLDYAKDVEPWIGDRVAVAVVPSDKADGAPAVMAALQVTDADAAATGLQRLSDCAAGGEGAGFAFTGDFAVVAESTRLAESLAARAGRAALADDGTFRRWVEEAGEPGILTVYAAPSAPHALTDLQHAVADEAWTSFEGMAGAVRFDDGAVELGLAGAGLPAGLSPVTAATAPSVAALPASTAAAVSVGLGDGWLESYLETLAGVFGDGRTIEEMLAEAEADTGLELPEDIETLFGEGVTLSVDSSLDPEQLSLFGPLGEVPIGLRVQGDPARIVPVVDKIQAAMGATSGSLAVASGDGVVAIGLSPSYVDSLVQGGTLGDRPALAEVVPDADRAGAVVFVDFDAGDGWLERLALTDQDPAAAENVRPLDALGISTWSDGDVQRGLVRVTTD